MVTYRLIHSRSDVARVTYMYVSVVYSQQAVRLESVSSQRFRYLSLVVTMGRQDTEEAVILGASLADVSLVVVYSKVPALSLCVNKHTSVLCPKQL